MVVTLRAGMWIEMLGLKQVLRWLLVPSAYQKAVLDVEQQGDTYKPNCFIILAVKSKAQ